MARPMETLAYQSSQPATPPRPACFKCGQRMEQGIVVSARENYWIAGEVKRNFFGVRLPRGPRYEIVTYRCVGCGFLENYSPPG